MFDSQSWKSRPDHAVCSVETGLHMIKAIKDVRHNTQVSNKLNEKTFLKALYCRFEVNNNFGRDSGLDRTAYISKFPIRRHMIYLGTMQRYCL